MRTPPRTRALPTHATPLLTQGPALCPTNPDRAACFCGHHPTSLSRLTSFSISHMAAKTVPQSTHSRADRPWLQGEGHNDAVAAQCGIRVQLSRLPGQRTTLQHSHQLPAPSPRVDIILISNVPFCCVGHRAHPHENLGGGRVSKLVCCPWGDQNDAEFGKLTKAISAAYSNR